MSATSDAVARGALLFANAEAALIALSAELPSLITAVRDDTGSQLGGLDALRATTDSMSSINAALGAVGAIHQALTNKCKELGIDVPAPVASSGGAQPLGGGR